MLKMVFNDRELNKRIGYTTNKHCSTRLKHLINKNISVVCFYVSWSLFHQAIKEFMR